MEDEADTTEDNYEVPEEYRADQNDTHDESPFAKLLQGIKL